MGPISHPRPAAGLTIEAGPSGHWDVTVEGRRLRVTNPGKVLWPSVGFTKGELVSYYLAVARYLLPHLADRPVTLLRAPDGVDNTYWFQTTCPHPPEWMPTRRVASSRPRSEPIDYCLIADKVSLVWVANLSAIELHPLLSRTGVEEEAEVVIFDLDPRPPAGLLECCRLARALRKVLDEEGCTPIVKTSGLAGLHVYGVLPERRSFTWARETAKSVGLRLEQERSELVTTSKRLAGGAGRVLIDWLQNSPRRSMPAPYSLRVAAIPLVSTPLLWEEVEAAAAEGRADELYFSPADVLPRLERYGDLFAPANFAE